MAQIPIPSLPQGTSEALNTAGNLTGMGVEALKGVAQYVTGLVPAGFTFGFNHIIEILIMHMIIIFIFHRILEPLKSLALAGVSSVLLPVFLNKLFGIAIPLSIETLAGFAVFGMAVYLILALAWKLALRPRGLKA